VAEHATIARPYARAAFESAQQAGALASWGDVLARASAVIGDARVVPLLDSPRVTHAALVDFVCEIAGVGADAHQRNFLQLLAENRRLELLPEIALQYEALRADVENTVEVTVTSAQALTPEQSAKFAAALQKRLKRTVRLHAEVDPALIGGAIVRAGDFVVDGSLRGRVARLANSMTAG
jgi:F-type H+-transporting ATPase subunit delta